MLENRVQALEDREAVRELVARYAWHVARAEAAELVALFAPGGRFGSPHAEALSGDRLLEFFSRNLHPRDRIPLVANHIVHLDGDHASGTCAMFSPWSPNGIMCGFYEDDYVRQEGSWRFAQRVWSDYSSADNNAEPAGPSL